MMNKYNGKNQFKFHVVIALGLLRLNENML